MIERDPIKRIMRHTELILNHARTLDTHSLKTEQEHTDEIIHTELPKLPAITSPNKTSAIHTIFREHNNHIELKALSITDHMKETIITHHNLHNKIDTLRKQKRI